jgi:hypothetical protein
MEDQASTTAVPSSVARLKAERERLDAFYEHEADDAQRDGLNRGLDLLNHALTAALEGAPLEEVAAAASAGALPVGWHLVFGKDCES